MRSAGATGRLGSEEAFKASRKAGLQVAATRLFYPSVRELEGTPRTPFALRFGGCRAHDALPSGQEQM